MSTPAPPSSPPPGWYADPTMPPESGQLRWWDGRSWSVHTHDPATATQGWSRPGNPAGGGSVAGSSFAGPGAGPGAGPRAQGLTPSGMRPLDAFFSDIGRIVKRGWRQILGLSLAVWIPVGVLLAVLGTTVIDRQAIDRVGRLIAGIDPSDAAANEETASDIAEAMRDVFPASPATYAAIGALLTVVFIVASLAQITGVNRLAMDAAADREVRMASGWQGVRVGTPRLLLFVLLATLVVSAIVLAYAALTAGAFALWVPLGAVLVIVGVIGGGIAAIWAFTRFVPVSAQAVAGPKPAAWSWHATKRPFWGVLGRYALWTFLMSFVLNGVTAVILTPVSLIYTAQPSASAIAGQMSTVLFTSLVTFPIVQAVAGLSTLGVVPIWRDLTDRPEWRSIEPDVDEATTQAAAGQLE